ncbi:hypothetical protein DB30_04293 [Enhygromyxa salina]|uniref:Uncharacterized protein n=1 Tax=Enhygromyxa salina TaxID=215803 RepID=A0A0C1ZGD0_9BACT|nr:hypothetical protein DB30_04293 [Enhygromyxa salina]
MAQNIARTSADVQCFCPRIAAMWIIGGFADRIAGLGCHNRW